MTLSISNLPLTMDASALEDMFTLIGDVSSARVLCHPDSASSLGRAIIVMSTQQEAENCALHFNGQVIQGCTLSVSLSDSADSSRRNLKTVARRPAYTKPLSKALRLVKIAKR